MRVPSIPSFTSLPSLLWRMKGGGGGIDPAFYVTHLGDGVTHMGVQVTNTPD